MPDPDASALDQHPNNVEPIALARPPMAVDPNPRRTSQLLLFAPVHRFDRITELLPPPGFHLDERHQPFSLDHQIDVAVPVSESALNDSPSLAPKPPFRDPLPQLPELLPGR